VGLLFDYRSYLQSISSSPFLRIASFFCKSPLWHCDTNSCSTAFFPMFCRRFCFLSAAEVSQDISVAKALVITFYSVFVEDEYPCKSYIFFKLFNLFLLKQSHFGNPENLDKIFNWSTFCFYERKTLCNFMFFLITPRGSPRRIFK